MFIIGVDPHKGSHTAAVLDRDEKLVDEIRVRADRSQRERLLKFAPVFEPRLWAIEGASGTGALLASAPTPTSLMALARGNDVTPWWAAAASSVRRS